MEAANAPDDVDYADSGKRTYGSLIAWNSSDQRPRWAFSMSSSRSSSSVARPSAIVRPIPSRPIVVRLYESEWPTYFKVDLRLLLRRLRLRPSTKIALPVHIPHHTLTFDAYVTQLQRQGYLDPAHIGAGGAAKKRRGGGGGATQQAGGGGEEIDVVWEWRWGPRAVRAEFKAERASRGSAGGSGGPGRSAGSGAGGERGVTRS